MLNEKHLMLGKEILRIVKALSNESRFVILTQLYNKPLTFKKLKEVTDLAKSALANNLNQLVDVDLIEKSQHGIYAITEDGKKLLEALHAFIEESNERRRKSQIAHTQRQMMKTFLERHVHNTRK